jgi:sugar phosphate isomerase/epimerase
MSSLAPQLRSCGVRLALEHNATATRENGFVHTLADAIEVACAAGIGVCVELQNCWTERHLAETFRRGMPHFTLVQVSDFVLGTPTRLTRAVPGDGDMPLEWMLANLLECGYEGDFDIELVGPHIEREGYAAAVGRSIGWLSERLHRWGL